jgi:hypothetical protein
MNFHEADHRSGMALPDVDDILSVDFVNCLPSRLAYLTVTSAVIYLLEMLN